ncbi:MAG: tRNA (adenosine(37)-N6)-dimethylallyltransferase MiaA [Saccharospirillum sp.]|nr:tRNA (adenosine(37)-N6)-dimethylallyltransferase MiaA [Saccharospirillum sp.]
MSADKPTAIFLMGPTAAGKTDLSLALTERLGCEIVSVDSALVYKGMNIGTAKPDAELRRRYPHHLIDLIDPAEAYSAARFREDAFTAIQSITGRGKIPLLTGGTMLYYKALVEPLATMPGAHPEIREAMHQVLQKEGLAPLLAELKEVDPEAWARIDRDNPQRVLRALEVYRASGRPISRFWAESVNDGQGSLSSEALAAFPWRLVQLCVAPDDRAVLHQRIALRFKAMLDQGFEAEVRQLFERGDLHPDLPSIRSVGYRQMWHYLSGEWSYQQMTERGIIATRQLAKRQLTWLRRWPDLTWLDSSAPRLEERAWQRLRKAGLDV